MKIKVAYNFLYSIDSVYIKCEYTEIGILTPIEYKWSSHKSIYKSELDENSIDSLKMSTGRVVAM